MDYKRKIMRTFNRLYQKALESGIFKRTPLFWQDYENSYPALRELEAAFPAIRAECLEILRMQDPDIDQYAYDMSRYVLDISI